MDYRSPSRDGRSVSRSPTPPSRYSASPSPRRRRYSSASPPPAHAHHNGNHRSHSSRSPSRGRGESRSPLRGSTKIVVEKLSKTINEDHLYEIFGQFGTIRDLDLPMSRQFGTNRGTAYILYVNETDAEAAIASMHEANLDGAIINVSIVLPRRRFDPSPPTASRVQAALVEWVVVDEDLVMEAPEAIGHLRLRVLDGQVANAIISILTDQDPTRGLGHRLRAAIAVAQHPTPLDLGRHPGAEVVEETVMMTMMITVNDVAVPAMTAGVAALAV
ncbi:RNA-binding domain-containing protein [Xylaria curta]|nr:RNA-binding domain-containing protein [Xylaria curta]